MLVPALSWYTNTAPAKPQLVPHAGPWQKRPKLEGGSQPRPPLPPWWSYPRVAQPQPGEGGCGKGPGRPRCPLGPGIPASRTAFFMLPAVLRPHLQTSPPAVRNVLGGRGHTTHTHTPHGWMLGSRVSQLRDLARSLHICTLDSTSVSGNRAPFVSIRGVGRCKHLISTWWLLGQDSRGSNDFRIVSITSLEQSQ